MVATQLALSSQWQYGLTRTCDVKQFSFPLNIDSVKIRILMIAEGLPDNTSETFYGSRESLYVANTLAAFNAAGVVVKTIDDVIRRGVYLTVAVKAVRQGLTFPSEIIREHSFALENEINQFPKVKAMLLMGDAAIKALNFIAQRVCGEKVIPAGSTYKIRGGKFFFKDIRVFPSYLQTGRNFLIEKGKQKMVAEDIRNAFALLDMTT
jgi:uracil-DNA glycosylase